MKPSLALILASALAAGSVTAQIAPPAPGVELPRAYHDRIAADPTAFQWHRAWIGKTRRAAAERRRYLSRNAGQRIDPTSLPDAVRRSIVVTGTLRVPVLAGLFPDGLEPYPITELDRVVFGPWSSPSASDYYAEISYGNLALDGDTYGWFEVTRKSGYYAAGCNGLCDDARTGQYLLELLVGFDAAVDFGRYDNDGPDGQPNSGDDDGFVDFVAFVQPLEGGECGNGHLWSHRWWLEGWPEFNNQPWTTNDPAAGGGYIKVSDYTIQPARSCRSGWIEIAVFCHEFGHAFGLPDLYDNDGGGRGIGEHGLMGHQIPNPANGLKYPAHMSAWSKSQLGWVIPTVVGPVPQTYTINTVNTTPEAYKLDVYEEKFARSGVDPIAGAYSLRCGLDPWAADARNWTNAGYGNGWDEAVRHDFDNDGSGTVTLRYDVAYSTEENADYGCIEIRTSGAPTTLAAYTGTGSATGVTIDLTPYIAGSASYQLIARFVSDYETSDEDDGHQSGPGGPFKIDNVSVTGGGVDYSSDFESHEDGWYYDFDLNPPREYFLVENRSRAATFDAYLQAEGLFIWHIEDNVARSVLGNSGGTAGITDLKPAGVMLEEADGYRQLLTGESRGDWGDIFPLGSPQRAFNVTTNPWSRSHNADWTQVYVNDISDPGLQMTATMRGGRRPPSVTSVVPPTAATGAPVRLTEVSGSSFIHGASIALRPAAPAAIGPSGPGSEITAQVVDWVGKTRLAGEIDLQGVPAGSYDVVVRNPDGQEAFLASGFVVTERVPVFIRFFDATPTDGGIRVSWELLGDEEPEGFEILRGDAGAAELVAVTIEPLDGAVRSFVDDTAEAGTYDYVLVVVLADGSRLRSQRASTTLEPRPLSLGQNRPNPFNPLTTIRYYLPAPGHVTLEVFDVAGRRVVTLLDGARPQGPGESTWDGRDAAGGPVASGVYVYRLRVGKTILSKKLVLLKLPVPSIITRCKKMPANRPRQGTGPV